jgi:tetratricopeptide (TPR) repeat protein
MVMRSQFFLASMLVGLAVWPDALLAPDSAFAAGARNSSGWSDEDAPRNHRGTILQFPGMPPIQVTPDGRIYNEQGFARPRSLAPRRPLKPSLSPEQQAKAAKAERLKRAMQPQKTHAEIRTELLDALFKRLGKASSADEADGIAVAIDRIWLRSDSATADLLMRRGLKAMEGRHLPLALSFFDRLVALHPNWAEAWQKRATTRLLGGDLNGAVADMRQVIKLEPRQFPALAALGFILHKQGADKEALAVLRKSQKLDPQQPQVNELIDTLSVKVEGRDI